MHDTTSCCATAWSIAPHLQHVWYHTVNTWYFPFYTVHLGLQGINARLKFSLLVIRNKSATSVSVWQKNEKPTVQESSKFATVLHKRMRVWRLEVWKHDGGWVEQCPPHGMILIPGCLAFSMLLAWHHPSPSFLRLSSYLSSSSLS